MLPGSQVGLKNLWQVFVKGKYVDVDRSAS